MIEGGVAVLYPEDLKHGDIERVRDAPLKYRTLVCLAPQFPEFSSRVTLGR